MLVVHDDAATIRAANLSIAAWADSSQSARLNRPRRRRRRRRRGSNRLPRNSPVRPVLVAVNWASASRD